MLTLILQLIAVYVLSKALWKVIRKRCRPSVLDNLRGPEPSSFWIGCMGELYDKNTGWAFQRDIADKFGAVMKMKGLFGEDQIYTFDPKAMHHIFVKDQSIYEQHPAFTAIFQLAFGEGVVGSVGDQHRKQHKMLNQVVTIAHLRGMIPVFYDVTGKLRRMLAKKLENGPQEIDLAPWMSRISLELIGQAGLGCSFDTFEPDEPTSPYVKAAQGLAPSFYPLRFVLPLVSPFVVKYGNPKFYRFVMDLLPYKALHHSRDIVDVMDLTTREIFAQKKQALANGDEAFNIGQGRDIMSLLMRANMTASKDDQLSEGELLGQMSTLTFAAMDTTSNALSRVFHILAQFPDIQERLRHEFAEAREQNGGEDLPYDTLISLPYLDGVCRETLRMYPPGTFSRRITTQDVMLPLSKPVRGVNGQEITEIPVPKNTEVLVSLISSNTNPEIWGPNANEWKPERWLSNLPDSVQTAHIPGVYAHLMTFIGGGRSCIGFKFALLEMKILISLLLEAFRISPSKREITWYMNIIATPAVKGENSDDPSLPVAMERIERRYSEV